MNGAVITIAKTDESSLIAAAKAHKISIDNKPVEIIKSSTGYGREYIKGRTSWSFSVDKMVLSGAAMKEDMQMVGNTYHIYIYKTQPDAIFIPDCHGVKIASGRAICTKFEVSARKGALVTGSFQFVGTGLLNFDTD